MTSYPSLIFLLCVFLFSSYTMQAQTPISGVVNEYYAVVDVNMDSNFVSLPNVPNLQEGDRILLIQMQGAEIDESQSSSFGMVNNYANAGSYEFHSVCMIQNNQVYFENLITNSYDSNEGLQLIYVPSYEAVILTDTLSGLPWDGNVGGILALEVDGVLDMNDHIIDMSYKGFQGGEGAVSSDDCNWTLNIIYTYHQNFDTEPWSRGRKGEGIAKIIPGKECGIGPQANGGGGGNNHNGGAGGGSNYGIGGRGGERIPLGTFNCNAPMGLPSVSMNSGYNANKIFLGGGGGAGHGNNPGIIGESGGNGGGIVFVKANEIHSNNMKITSNGASVLDDSTDGGAGGGAGGTIILDVNLFVDSLVLEAFGGSGAEVINGGLSNCNGPGGGGGGGVVISTQTNLPDYVTTNVGGGLSGTIIATDQTNCVIGSQNSAQNGSDGGGIYNWNLTGSDELSISCLPDCIPPDVPVLQFSAIDVCEGEQAVITIESGELNGADHWAWFEGECNGEAITTGDSLTVAVDDVAVFYVAGIGGCLTDTIGVCSEVIVTTHPTYNNSGSTNLCEGEQIIFNGELVSEPGLYTINLLSEYGCDSTININVTVTEIDNGIFANDTSLEAIQDNATYSWIDCQTDEFIPNENAALFSPQFSSEFAVEVSVDDCTVTSDCVYFDYGINVDEYHWENSVLVYPNPATDYLQIDDFPLQGKSRLTLYNALNQTVLLVELNENNNQKIYLENLPPGTYLGRIYSEEKTLSFKFVIE